MNYNKTEPNVVTKEHTDKPVGSMKLENYFLGGLDNPLGAQAAAFIEAQRSHF
jgi:hypothetical protein